MKKNSKNYREQISKEQTLIHYRHEPKLQNEEDATTRIP